jgi:hypothetical protein
MSLVISKVFTYDTDAGDYIQRVEGASGDNQALEPATRQAINNFVIGCKQDGIWNAIKASCILSGARTLNGALQPLAGTAPTNFNFVSGDYNRKTGLAGNGSTKYLNSSRNNNADPQNSQHLSAYVTEQPNSTGSGNYVYLGTNWSQSGSSAIGRSGTLARPMYAEMRYGTGFEGGSAFATTGFFGASIGSSSTFSVRYSGKAASQLSTSATPRNEDINVFRNGGGSVYTANRLAFYSIGESLDLALLDARVTALITAFGVAIP